METQILDCSYWVQWTLHPHRKPKPQAEHDHAMSKILSLNLLLSSGTLTPSLAEPATMSIIHLISPRFNSMTPQPSFPSHLIPLYQYFFCSAFQPCTRIHPHHDHFTDRTRRICTFQPVLQAYPTQHYWIITAHISLGKLEQHWKLFKWQLTKMKQFLTSLEQHHQPPHSW